MTNQLGRSEYKIRLKNQSGIVVAEFDNWLSLNFNHKQNSISSVRFEIDGRDSRTELFELDGQIEVWRRNESAELDWYIEWEGFFRTPNDLITASDDQRFVAHGTGYLGLLKRAYILWPSKSSQAQKSAVGETVIKEIVRENIGEGALSASGRINDHVFPGVTVETDFGRGTTWSGSFAWKLALSTARNIAIATGLVIDIVGTGPATFEFRVYEGQRGEDKTVGTTDPLIFSTDFGNMRTPLLSINRGDEITSVTALGQGVEGDRNTTNVRSSARSDSPWNEIETVLNSSQSDSDDELTSAAESELQAKKKIEALSFEVLQTASSFYGKTYTWGTKATARFKDFETDITIDDVNVTINGQNAQENITIRFSNKNEVEE
jgi:hypothetical protein